MNIITHIEDNRNHRRRVRMLDLNYLIQRAVDNTVEKAACTVQVAHGGSVPNNYGYPATTDGIVVVAIPHYDTIHVVITAAELPANKVTLGGVAATCGYSRALADERYSRVTRKAARSHVIANTLAQLGISE